MNTIQVPPAQPGLLLVLSAPSGAGKTTLARRLIDETPGSRFSISYTTRSPRGLEKNGLDYYFLDHIAFQEKIEKGEFVEWAEVHGHFYGSPQSSVDDARRDGSMSVFDIDVQGGQVIKAKHPDTVLVFILPPSFEELERRLRERKTDAEATIRARMLAARAEIERGVSHYDYILINDDIERCYGELRAVVTAEKCRRGRVDLGRLKLERPTAPT